MAALRGGGVAAAAFVLLMGSEKASPWKETDKLRVEVTRSFAASGSGVVGRERRRSTDWERLGSKGVEEFVECERRGEGNRREEELVVVEVEVEVEVVVVVVVVVVEEEEFEGE